MSRKRYSAIRSSALQPFFENNTVRRFFEKRIRRFNAAWPVLRSTHATPTTQDGKDTLEVACLDVAALVCKFDVLPGLEALVAELPAPAAEWMTASVGELAKDLVDVPHINHEALRRLERLAFWVWRGKLAVPTRVPTPAVAVDGGAPTESLVEPAVFRRAVGKVLAGVPWDQVGEHLLVAWSSDQASITLITPEVVS